MTDARRFARFRPEVPPGTVGVSPVPEDGLCLSAFLLLSPTDAPDRVLVGRVAPRAEWGELAALDPARVAAFGGGWMLPACQLVVYESPEEAARRIAREQLGVAGFRPGPPTVLSEAYARPTSQPHEFHWDLSFLFRGTYPGTQPPSLPIWKELRFVDPGELAPSDFARGHGDVVAAAGFRLRG